MTYAGARGNTAAEMAKTLHFALKPERLHPAFADFADRLMRSGNRHGGQLLVANSLWGQQGYPIRYDFLHLTHDDNHADMKEVDFQRDTEAARQTINHWVEQKTQDMVKELLKPAPEQGQQTRPGQRHLFSFALGDAVLRRPDQEAPFPSFPRKERSSPR